MLFTSAISIGSKFRAIVLTQSMRTLIKTYSTSTGSPSGSSSESSSGSSSDSSDSDSDTEDAKKTKPVENVSSSSLDTLVDNLISMKHKKTIDVAMPVRKTIQQDKLPSKKTNLSHEAQLTQAVHNITNNLTENKEEVKTQLLDKLSSMYKGKKNYRGSMSKNIENIVLDHKSSSSLESENISSNEQWKYKADVARTLNAHDKSKHWEQKEEPSHIRELLKNKKIEKEKRTPEIQQQGAVKQARDKPEQWKNRENPSHIRELLANTRRKKNKTEPEQSATKQRGNIFLNMKEPMTTIPELSTWAILENRELDLIANQSPQNIFQEMIQWTESGKLWKFPINNEIGMEKESNVHFSEHVFLERHLKDWCPTRGPIRHFMELVCVGLSKNPYMTVNEKTDHIAWYKEYFKGKKDILLELGAIQASSDTTKKITT